MALTSMRLKKSEPRKAPAPAKTKKENLNLVPSGDLLEMDEKQVGELLLSKGGINHILLEIERLSKGFYLTVKTEQGRKDIKSLAYKIARSKTFIDGVGKQVTAEWQKKVRAVNAERNYAKQFLDDLKKSVRAPLDEWEMKNTEPVITEEKEKPAISPQKRAAAHRKVKQGLMKIEGMNEGLADAVIQATANGEVPKLVIEY